jgi:hypothetical protein
MRPERWKINNSPSLMVSNYNPLHSTSKGKALSSNFKPTITNQTANMGELPKYYSRIDKQLIKLMLTPKSIQLSHMLPPNTRGVYFESLVSG